MVDDPSVATDIVVYISCSGELMVSCHLISGTCGSGTNTAVSRGSRETDEVVTDELTINS